MKMHSNFTKAHSPSKEEEVNYAVLNLHTEKSNKITNRTALHYADLDLGSSSSKPPLPNQADRLNYAELQFECKRTKSKLPHSDLILDVLKPPILNDASKGIRSGDTLNVNSHNTEIEYSWWRKKKWLICAVGVIACVSVIIPTATFWNMKSNTLKTENSKKKANVEGQSQDAAIDCGSPPRPAVGGEAVFTDTKYLSQVTYMCYTGYVRSYDVTRTCTAQGVWQGDPATCDPAPNFYLLKSRDCTHNDISYTRKILDNCAQSCDDIAECVAFVVWPRLKHCWLKKHCDRHKTTVNDIRDIYFKKHETYLKGNGAPYRGVVQIVHNGVNYSICDRGWEENDCKVICREGGYGGGKVIRPGNFAGLVVGPPMLENVDCAGTEQHVTHCGGVTWTPRSCSYNHLAGCKCERGPPY